MAEKKYYWLKIKDTFFEDDTIKYIEEQENGIKYSNFYLKLCLKSVRTNGKLIRLVGETLIPYDIKSLSNLTGVDFDTTRSAMQLFESLGIVNILENGELYLSQITELIGSETDKASIMRRKRAEEKVVGNIVTEMLPYKEKEKDKEIELDKDINKKPTKNKYGEYKHVLLTIEQYERLQNDYPNHEDMITNLDEYIQMTGKKYKDHYLTMKTWARKNKQDRKEEPKMAWDF